MSDLEQSQPVQKQLGKLPARGDPRTINFARFVDVAKVPTAYDPWKRKAAFPARKFGNTEFGDCTIASQCNHMSRLERIESKRTPQIADEEAVRVYFDMTWRDYGDGKSGAAMPPEWRVRNGPGDTGAYELDALNNWRKPDLTFRDTAGNPLTISAFAKVNQSDHEEVKTAIAVSGKFGIKLCLNLPLAFQRIDPPQPWDVPAGQALTGDWQPGTWGGHSLYADAYDKTGVRLVHSWYYAPPYQQTLTWAAMAAYCDEMHWVLDSVDGWQKRTPQKLAAGVDLAGIIKKVNAISATKVKA